MVLALKNIVLKKLDRVCCGRRGTIGTVIRRISRVHLNPRASIARHDRNVPIGIYKICGSTWRSVERFKKDVGRHQIAWLENFVPQLLSFLFRFRIHRSACS